MFREKNDKEISLHILNAYTNFFAKANENCHPKETTAFSNSKSINDVLEEDCNEPFTNELIQQITEEFFKENNDKRAKSEEKPQLPQLIPKDSSSSFRYAYDICALLSQYENNGSHLQKELEIFLMRLERNYYVQRLPLIISKIIDRVTGMNVNESFNEFVGPFIIGSYINGFHFFSETIDLLLHCSNLSQLINGSPALFQRLTTFLCKRLMLQCSEQIIQGMDDITGIFKVLIKIKSSNVKLSLYFVDKDNIKYEEMQRSMKSIAKQHNFNNDKAILCKVLRLWRRKWNLSGLLPEVIDYIAERCYSYSISAGFTKVLYSLYTMKIGENYHPWIREQMTAYKSDAELKSKISFACRNTFALLSARDFEKIFI